MNEKWRQELTMKVFSPDLWKVEALVTLICSNQGPRPSPTIPILNGQCDGALQLFPDINLLLEQTVVGTNAMGHPLRCESEHGNVSNLSSIFFSVFCLIPLKFFILYSFSNSGPPNKVSWYLFPFCVLSPSTQAALSPLVPLPQHQIFSKRVEGESFPDVWVRDRKKLEINLGHVFCTLAFWLYLQLTI